MKPSGARRWTVLYLAAGGLFLCAAALSCAYLLLLQASPLDGRAQILLVLILYTCTAAAILIALFTLLHVFIFRPLEVLDREVHIIASINPGHSIELPRNHLLGDLPQALQIFRKRPGFLWAWCGRQFKNLAKLFLAKTLRPGRPPR